MKTFALCSLCAVLAAAAFCAHSSDLTNLTIKDKSVRVEVARDEAARSRGLMFREKLEENSGMLFVMDQSDLICMWMKNTLIPLSVAFIDEHGQILNIEPMQPQTLSLHCSKGAARFALEMNLDWFKKQNIGPGDRIEHLPSMK